MERLIELLQSGTISMCPNDFGGYVVMIDVEELEEAKELMDELERLAE